MPEMDGFAVMEALKTNERDPWLPVIVLTAQPGHKLRALQAGAKDFISKPFDLLEVRTRIHNMLEMRLLYRRLAAHSGAGARRWPSAPPSCARARRAFAA
jgi:CheY-like chemotaxis protein